MGYTHYWYRPLTINPTQFRKIAADFNNIVLALDDMGVKLADWEGKNVPEINNKRIAFNGLSACGHTINSDVVIPWPTKDAAGIRHSIVATSGEWFAGTTLNARCCNGDCSYESLVFPRVEKKKSFCSPQPDGLQFECCKTAFRPYDLAVTAFLLIAKHYMGDKIRVSSDGEDCHWKDARRLCACVPGLW